MINHNCSSKNIPNRTSIKLLDIKVSQLDKIQAIQRRISVRDSRISSKQFELRIVSDGLLSRRVKSRQEQKSARETEEIERKQEERDTVWKNKDFKVVRKRREIDTLVAVASIFILYCLALHLAPYQFYSPLQQ